MPLYSLSGRYERPHPPSRSVNITNTWFLAWRWRDGLSACGSYHSCQCSKISLYVSRNAVECLTTCASCNGREPSWTKITSWYQRQRLYWMLRGRKSSIARCIKRTYKCSVRCSDNKAASRFIEPFTVVTNNYFHVRVTFRADYAPTPCLSFLNKTHGVLLLYILWALAPTKAILPRIAASVSGHKASSWMRYTLVRGS